MTVHRFLVTGTEEQLRAFHILVSLLWDLRKQYGRQTMLYTATDWGKIYGIKHAEKLGLTVQMRTKIATHQRENPWKIIVQGDNPGWEWTPPRKNKETSPPSPGDVIDIDR